MPLLTSRSRVGFSSSLGHPVAVALDAAERHRVQVAPRADRGAIAAPGVGVEEPAQVRVRDEVAVEQEHGLGGRLRQQAERAGRAERLVLAQVLDSCAEPRCRRRGAPR